MAPKRRPVRGLFLRQSHDPDAPEYASVPPNDEHDPNLDPGDGDGNVRASSDDDDDDDDDNAVLREEEEREKLLAGGLFGNIGGGGSIKIGKKVGGGGRRQRKKAKQVAQMMGGKRLGMEDGSEYGLASGSDTDRLGSGSDDGHPRKRGSDGDDIRDYGSSDDTDGGSDKGGEEEEEEEEEEEGMMKWGEKTSTKPRKPTGRKLLLLVSLLLTFLGMAIFGSLALSQIRRRRLPSAFAAAEFSNGTHAFTKTTLLISLDGFRADFLSRHLTPTLAALVASGVAPAYMTPSFPTVTFPNHWSLATGLYPETHGIVGNTFWDPVLKRGFFYTDPARSLQHEWWGGEPIWHTVEAQGGIAAVHMWPGSEARGCGARHVDHYNAAEPLPRKVARILGWLDLPADQRPQFVAAYVPDVDASGHKYGPNSTETDAAIARVDAMLHELLAGLEARNLTDIINIVVVSDHGMASTSRDRLIYLDDLVDPALIEHTDGWPLFGLRPYAQHNVTEIYETIAAKHRPGHSHWEVYLRDTNMPERFHFTRNRRIAPLWIVPEASWTVVTKKEFPPGTPGEYHLRGLHGFDNLHPLMRSIFVARGPAFRHLHGEGKAWLGLDRHSGHVDGTRTQGAVRGGRVAPFANTEVYRLLCASLGLQEEPSNATLSALTLLPDLEDDSEKEKSTAVAAATTTSSKTPIGVQTLSNTPQRPTKISDPDQPAISATHVANIGISAPGADPDAPPPTKDAKGKGGKKEKTWWELLKSKAERLKSELEGWWSDLWVDGRPTGKKKHKGKGNQGDKEGAR